MSRYDPDPSKPYGVCSTCGNELADREAVDGHFRETMAGFRSHSVMITNPTRVERITRELDDLVESALYDFTNEAERLLDDVTEEEITEAMRRVHGDFADAWERRNE